MSEYKTIDQTVVESSIIQSWRDQVEQLKPKKRKNWKSSLVDKSGGKTKVIYKMEEDKFYNWCTISHCWAEVITYSTLLERCDEFRRPSNMMKYFYMMIDVIEEQLARKVTSKEKEEILDRVTSEWVKYTHTGNHVPVANRASPNKRRYAVPLH